MLLLFSKSVFVLFLQCFPYAFTLQYRLMHHNKQSWSSCIYKVIFVFVIYIVFVKTYFIIFGQLIVLHATNFKGKTAYRHKVNLNSILQSLSSTYPNVNRVLKAIRRDS